MAPKEDIETRMTSAISSARAAYRIQTTTSSHNWRQRQLHGLFSFLMAQKDSLIRSLCEETGFMIKQYEQELAFVFEDIARHYAHTTKSSFPLKSDFNPFPGVEQRLTPVGVSAIVVDSVNPIRFAFGPLAANIAVGNTVVVVNGLSNNLNTFWTILEKEAPSYLDSTAIHFVEGFEHHPILLNKVDLLTVFAESPERYNSILEQPNAQFVSTKSGSSVVVVDEGSKNYDDLVKQVFRSFSFQSIRPEAADAVFLREDEISHFEKSFNTVFSTASAPDNATQKKLQYQGFEQFAPAVFRIDLARMVSSDTKLPNLQNAMDGAAQARVLLVVVYRTIDHAIDAFRQLSAKPAYLSLLAPYSKANADYFENWTTSTFYSKGFIMPVTPSSGSMPSDVVFPPVLFSRSRISMTIPQPDPAISLDKVIDRIQSVVIKPTAAPNQTDDFFLYMERNGKRVGVVFAGLCVAGAYAFYTKRLSK